MRDILRRVLHWLSAAPPPALPGTVAMTIAVRNGASMAITVRNGAAMTISERNGVTMTITPTE